MWQGGLHVSSLPAGQHSQAGGNNSPLDLEWLDQSLFQAQGRSERSEDSHSQPEGAPPEPLLRHRTESHRASCHGSYIFYFSIKSPILISIKIILFYFFIHFNFLMNSSTCAVIVIVVTIQFINNFYYK